ncbi:unnamed protein product [Gongylonema pulchrum]|uniref:Uncharacterized protein n=1 Tax=Gongylonema pulchrum TaxID=637853 RepID=A0A3P7NL51_9BILA|nr:unnamed protein product [Gongylonema pulchrum]
MMLRYMKMVEEQRRKDKLPSEQSPEKPHLEGEPLGESFVTEVAEIVDAPSTPSDFGW